MNKTKTSNVGAIPKAQKAQVFRIVEGDPLGFLKIQLLAKHQHIERERGTP